MAWLNREGVGRFKGTRALKPGQDGLNATLKPGCNRILMEVLQRRGEWLACMQIAGLGGGSVDFTVRER